MRVLAEGSSLSVSVRNAQDLRRSQPASSADASRAAPEEEAPDCISLARLVRRSSSIRVSATHQTGGPSDEKNHQCRRQGHARLRLRPAFRSCITPSEAITTRRVCCATARSRSAWLPASAASSSSSRFSLLSPLPAVPVTEPDVISHQSPEARIAARSSLGLIAANPRRALILL